MNQSYEQAIQITPTFLNSVLKSVFDSDQTSIVDVRSEQITGDTMFNALLLRLYLTYDQPHTRAPKSLIAKLPATNPDPELLERSQVFQPGSRENWFYRSGAHRSPLHVPHCYYNETDRSTGESILLLEDLAPARPGSWLEGATLQQAELALSALARFHAHWWGAAESNAIQELAHLLSGNGSDEQNLVQELFDRAWPQFLMQKPGVLPADVEQFGAAIVGNMEAVDAPIDQGPPTLTHGDYRLDNMLFGRKDGKPICWVVDWEDVFFGSGMIDVSWFLGGCLPVEQSHHEIHLLQHYYQTLLAGGVEGYTWAQCYADYRRAMCSSFVQGILSATEVDTANEYETQLAYAIGQRFIAAAQRLRLLELMDL